MPFYYEGILIKRWLKEVGIFPWVDSAALPLSGLGWFRILCSGGGQRGQRWLFSFLGLLFAFAWNTSKKLALLCLQEEAQISFLCS